MVMIRFWFEFDFEFDDNSPPGMIMGCGLTAYNYEDAFSILEEKAFPDGVPKPKSVIENIDVSKLDSDHVIPNMGNIFNRGIWFPLGYE